MNIEFILNDIMSFFYCYVVLFSLSVRKSLNFPHRLLQPIDRFVIGRESPFVAPLAGRGRCGISFAADRRRIRSALVAPDIPIVHDESVRDVQSGTALRAVNVAAASVRTRRRVGASMRGALVRATHDRTRRVRRRGDGATWTCA